jgi:hypothetical protein
MPRKTPVVWSQQEISVLTKLHLLHGDTPEGLHKTEKSFERHTPTDVRAKLVELELMPKPAKPALSPNESDIVNKAILTFVEWKEPQKTLAVRYAIETLQAMLPKRAPKAVPADG